MRDLAWFFLAALCEIGGCYCFWMWLRLQRDVLWVLPGTILLIVFALALTRVEAQFAGRAFAAYGGIYIIASLAWLNVVENARPLASDWLGVGLCLLGALVILFGPLWLAGHP
ncbi:MAG: YnfA family protein [Gammaproteobacteria bacterium]|nr:YnfA family protein [Gammaproteobacteria bacterium]